MDKIEQTLKRIKSKDQLHRLIDEMPDNTECLLIAVELESDFGVQYGIYGEPTASTLLWFVEVFKRWLFKGQYE